MDTSTSIVTGAGLADAVRKSRLPARLDFVQSATGLVLALFMWGHMFFVSSILLGKDAMWTITKLFEGYFVFGRAYPGIVSVASLPLVGPVCLPRYWAMISPGVNPRIRKAPISR